VLIDRDENPRADTTLEQLTKLKPVLGGVCTAGNSSTENDGAAVCVMTSEVTAKNLVESHWLTSKALPWWVRTLAELI
jgi:acetyl-CoA C-acetyltransferase